MPTSTLRVTIGPTTYFVDDPKSGDGLKATVSATVEEVSARGAVTRILHRDRLNLDRAKDRAAFAAAAGADPGDLLEVRDRVLDFLAPPPNTSSEGEEEVDEAARQAACELLAAPDLLDRVEAAVRALGYAGERWLPLLLYLVFVSRLLPRPINVVIAGPSAGGKSFVVMLVARMFPVNATYALNGMSERLLAYTDADLRHRTLIIGEASALQRDGIGASLLRSVAWEGSVTYETVEKTAQGLQARRIEKPGPTGFVTTTTGRVEPELETRVLTAHVPDDEATTRVILRATAAHANGHAPDEPDLAPWHALQRLLTAGDQTVTIPFADALAEAYRADQVRSRRDFVQLLGLIQAHALLFREQRARDDLGRVVADARDYRAVYALAGTVFGAIAAEGVTPAVRETAAAVAHLVPDGEAEPATVSQVAAQLGVHKSVASRRVAQAVKGGWVTNEEARKGRPLKLRPGDPLPEERSALPSPDALFAEPACNRATVQPQDGDPHDDAENGHASGCADGCRIDDGDVDKPVADAPVAERLQRLVQPQNPHTDAENALIGECGCTVAADEWQQEIVEWWSEADDVSGDAPEDGAFVAAHEGADVPPRRACAQCSVGLPEGWVGFYCARHGGHPPDASEEAGNDRYTR